MPVKSKLPKNSSTREDEMNIEVSNGINDQDNISYLLLRTAIAKYEKKPTQLTAAELSKIQQQVVKEYELQNLILSSKEASDIIIPQSVIDSSLAEVKNRYSEEDEFLSDIESNDMSEAGFCAALVRELKVEAVLDRVSAKAVSISDMDIMVYYHMHYERFKLPETRTASHILITINEEFKENGRDEAMKRMQAIRARLIKKTKRFSEQALKHSECPTAMNGGLLGRVRPGDLYPELDKMLFRMKEGQISEIVESELGYHILYCQQIHGAGPASLEDTREKIKTLLQDRAKRMCQKAWLKQLVKHD